MASVGPVLSLPAPSTCSAARAPVGLAGGRRTSDRARFIARSEQVADAVRRSTQKQRDTAAEGSPLRRGPGANGLAQIAALDLDRAKRKVFVAGALAQDLAGGSGVVLEIAQQVFGPKSPAEPLRATEDLPTMRRALEGAKLATAVRAYGWNDQIRSHLVAQGINSDFLAGFDAGLAVDRKIRVEPQSVGLELLGRGACPSSPDCYQLSIEGLSPLVLEAGAPR